MTVLARLMSRRDRSIRAIEDALLEHPGYADLRRRRPEQLAGELHHAVTRALLRAPTREAAGEADWEFYREIGRRRAADRFLPDELRDGLNLAFLAYLRDLLGAVDEFDHGSLVELTAYYSREFPPLADLAVLECGAVHRRNGNGGPARAVLLSFLLDGNHAAAAAGGFVVAPAYVVLVCRTAERGSHRSELRDGALRERALRPSLESVPDALWCGDIEEDGLIVLLPAQRHAFETTEAVATSLTEAVAERLGARVTATLARAEAPEDIPAALAEARQAVEVAAAIPATRSRPYRVQEILVELTVARQPALRQRLTRLLDPLASGTELWQTLDVLFGHDLDRERTAKALSIHRRTLGYRLTRIRELTGIDPATAHGIQLLRIALTATRLPAPASKPPAPPEAKTTVSSLPVLPLSLMR